MSSENSIEYREIPGCPGYRAGSDGSLWSEFSGGIRSGKWRNLATSVHRHRGPGRTYLCIDLWVGGKRSSFLVHRLILEAFVGPRPKGMECRHLDGNPRNNAIANLRWGTREQNTADTRRFGRFDCKLTEAKVKLIRKLRFVDGMKQKEIAIQLGIPRTTVNSVVNRHAWRHID